MSQTSSSSMTSMALTGGGAFIGGYSGIAARLGFIPQTFQAPVGCLAGAAMGSVANNLVGDTAISYQGAFMTGMWAFGGSFLAGMIGGGLGISPLLVQSGGGAAGALIGTGVGGIKNYF